MRIRKTFILFASLLISGTSLAQNNETCSATVVYGNGIGTTLTDATLSLGTLRQGLAGHLTQVEFDELSFALAYNQSSGLYLDLLEGLELAGGRNLLEITEWLLGRGDMPEVAGLAIADILKDYDSSTIDPSIDLAMHLELYRDELAAGNRVIVVAHSQGNFFANMAWEQLTDTERQSFAIVSVGTPDDVVAGGTGPDYDGEYWTSFEDLVVLAIELASDSLIPDPLPANIANGLSVVESRISDYTGHFFVESYLRQDGASRTLIFDRVSDLAGSLACPGST